MSRVYHSFRIDILQMEEINHSLVFTELYTVINLYFGDPHFNITLNGRKPNLALIHQDHQLLERKPSLSLIGLTA